jgi:hypothetical protein
MYCKINLESLAQISAFKSKKQNVSITYVIHFRAFKDEKDFKKTDYIVVTHCYK